MIGDSAPHWSFVGRDELVATVWENRCAAFAGAAFSFGGLLSVYIGSGALRLQQVFQF